MREAQREVECDVCDVAAARAFVAQLQHRAVRCRYLAEPSPFVESWTRVAQSAAESVETPKDALRRLHAELTGAVPIARLPA